MDLTSTFGPNASARSGLWALISLIATSPATVWGQDGPAATDGDSDLPVDEIVLVIGSKLGQTRAEVAQSVAYLDEQRLRDDYILNVEDVFDRTANAFTGATLFGAYSIRGVKSTNVTDGFSRANALSTVLINGTALGISATDYVKPSLFDARVVEILRGPQSVAQGPNALIGSIVIDYNDPTFDGYEGSAVGEFGELGTLRLATVQNLALVPDVLAARITLETRQSDGAVNNPTTGQDDVQRTDEETIRTQFRLQPLSDERLVIDLTYLRNRSDSNPFANSEANDSIGQSLFDRVQTVDEPDSYPSSFDFLSLEADWSIDDRWALRSVTGYGDFRSTQRLDGDASPAPLFVIDFDVSEEILSQEVRLHYTSPRLQLLTGLFYSDARFENGFDFQGLLPGESGELIPFSQFQTTAEDVKQLAVFAKGSFALTQRLHATLGLRLNREERAQRLLTDQLGAPLSFDGDADFTQILPSASLRYDISEQSAIGALYSRGYQGGGFAVGLILNEVQPYDEEFIDNYEIFLRHRTLNDRLTLSANVFYFDWRDQQVPFTPEGGFPGLDEFIANAGSSSVFGLELDVQAQVTETLSMFFSIGVSDTQFDEFTVDGQDLSGQPFPGAPDFNLALGLTYQSPTGWFGAATYTYVDSTYTELASPDFTAIRARNLLAGRVGYRREHWSVFAFGQNLLDEDYELAVFDRRVLGVPDPIGRVADPRVVGAGFSLNW
ncbi:MAG: TonB-dependent receptor [Pseudomonadota bacterium]